MEHIDHDYLSTQVIQIPSRSKTTQFLMTHLQISATEAKRTYVIMLIDVLIGR